MGKVLVLGSINTDLVTYVEKLPHKGETVTGGKFSVFAGGKGANQAVAASRAGGKVLMFGAVGDDSYGRERLNELKAAGVDIGEVVVKKNIHSGVAQIIVDRSGENIIAVAPGANFEFSPVDVILPRAETYGHKDKRGEVDIALFQNELREEVTEKLIKKAYSMGYCVIWNIAPAFVEAPSPETLKCVDYLICNEVELSELFAILNGRFKEDISLDRNNVEILAGELLKSGVRNVVVTLGSKGSILVGSDRGETRSNNNPDDELKSYVVYQDAYKVKPLDTVGAGDCFVGVFAAFLSRGEGHEGALKYASAAASLSVTRKGAQASMPTLEEIDKFLGSQV